MYAYNHESIMLSLQLCGCGSSAKLKERSTWKDSGRMIVDSYMMMDGWIPVHGKCPKQWE
jgi:hypothetical protein